jgi:hypothetical protein
LTHKDTFPIFQGKITQIEGMVYQIEKKIIIGAAEWIEKIVTQVNWKKTGN